jgi:hypothetical protein
MKECHPDKFQGDEAGLKARKKVKSNWGLPFLSKYQNYKAELTWIYWNNYNATITDYKFVEGRLIINFSNGSVYEYISVPKATYVKW